MKNDPEKKEKIDLRRDARLIIPGNASVEFNPGSSKIAYHFSLKNFSSKGFGILVRKDSKVLELIKTGDILDMKFHPNGITTNPARHRTEIKHMSEPASGSHSDHLLVGLMVLEGT